MKILALEHEMEGTSTEAFAPHLRREALRAWELVQAEVIREIYFDPDRHTAVLMLECADLEQASSVLATLPLVEAGLISFDLIALTPYSGFARLFADG